MYSFAEEVGQNARRLSERYMNPENVLKFNHGHSWIAPGSEFGDKVGTFKEYSSATEVQLSDIVEGRAGMIFHAVNRVAEEMHGQMERMLLEVMEEAAERTGRFVEAAGRPMREAMFEALESMELPLDKDGELSMPSLFVGPSQHRQIIAEMSKVDPEFSERMGVLKERKKEEARTKELGRLSRYERL